MASGREANMKYEVVGAKSRGYAVVMKNGVIEYDLIEKKEDAEEICDILNRGIGPEWDAVEAELDKAQDAGGGYL